MERNKSTILRLIWTYPLVYLAIIGMHSTAVALNIQSDQQLKYADALFTNQQYLRAAEEYQRFIFFFPDHPRTRATRFKAGESFLLAKDPGTAITILKPLSSTEPPDNLAIEAFFMLSDCYLELNRPTHAIVQLNNAIVLSDPPATKDRAYYKIGWIHIDFADWDSARKAFSRMSVVGKQQYRVDELDDAISDTKTIPTKSPFLAGALSIVPGAGQLYCNRYEDALIAFVVNTGLIWAAYDAFDNEQYGLGGLLSFVGLGFYAGNIYGAVNDAHKYNLGQIRQFVDQLKQYQMQLTTRSYDATPRHGLVLSLKIPF